MVIHMESPANRVLTVPNAISFLRLLCIPLFVYLVFGLDKEATAAVMLAVLGATDWIDGYIARRFNQESAVGKFVDPAADRLLLAVAAITIIVRDAMPLWFGIAALTREALVIAGGIYLVRQGIKGLDVEYVGKAGAFALMFSFPFFLIADSGVSWAHTAQVLAWICGVPGIILNYVSAYHYFKRARVVIARRQSEATAS